MRPRHHRLLGLCLGLLSGFNVAWAAGGSKARYPQIEAASGSAIQVGETIQVSKRQAERSEVERTLKPKMVLKDKAVLRTGEKSELRVALRANSVLNLGENSEVEFPAIEWQDGNVTEIRLRRGKVRMICSEACRQKFLTPLFEGLAINGDVILAYDPSVPQVELDVLQGEMPFRGLENETSVTLTAGHRAVFKGVLENGEPAYDVLLRGRKVAKGVMGEIQEIPASEMSELQKQEEKRKKVVKLPPKSKRLPSQICDRPWGELNQCMWACEKNKKGAKECLLNQGATCIRQRCNANGQWSDRTELPLQNSPCKASTFVGTCDY
jgi:hypothetical protein